MAFSDSSGLSSPISNASALLEEVPVPSSPLSSFSRTPSPPPHFRLCTPPPSQDAGDDMPRPRKRRKIERPDRTTRYLDLTEDAAQSIYDRNDAINKLQYALRKRRKIVVIAGAGISVSAGIPDFRSANGLFAGLQKEHKLKGGSGKQLFDASVYKDSGATSQFHDMVRKLSKMSKVAQPTPFHHMLARLSTEGRLLRLYSQNVDGLETQIPPLKTEVPLPHKGPWPQTIQLHGGLEKMMCQKCREIMDFDSILFEGAEPPTCPKCRETDEIRTNDLGRRSHGIGRLRPRIVLYNESNPDEEAIGAVSAADMRTRPDAIVVVGTSMKIPGVRRIVSEMCKIVRDRKEGTTIWINPDPEPSGPLFDNCWDLIVKGGSDQVANLINLREWDNPNMEEEDLPTEYTDSDVEKINEKQGEIRIDIPISPAKRAATLESAVVMTPPRSQAGDSQTQGEARPSSSQKSSPARITLKVGIKSEEVEKQRQKGFVPVQVHVPPHPKTKNPASAGKKLTDVLGKENVVKNKKSKTSMKKSKEQSAGSTKTSQAKLGMKVSKSSSSQQIALKKQKDGFGNEDKWTQQHNRHSSIRDSDESQYPMVNAAVSRSLLASGKFNDSEQIPTPGLTSPGSTPHDTPDPQTPPSHYKVLDDRRSSSGSLSYDRHETVSPKGPLPKGMEGLLS